MQLRSKQHGIALYVVIVFVMLASLLALWASRSSFFNELLIGNEADYRRAYEAAQAMLQDAELDIRGVNPDGSFCTPSATMGDICRRTTAVYFDFEIKDLEKIFSQLDLATSTKCFAGICQKRTGAQDFWNNSAMLTAMTQPGVGARYGQFTGATQAIGGNPLLEWTSGNPASQRAWYWVEVLPYVDPNSSLLSTSASGNNVERYAPSRKKPVVYRITALARGVRPGTEVVLQSTLSLKSIE